MDAQGISPLEKSLREDCEKIVPNMRLFIAPAGFPEDRLVIWDGEDIEGFLSCAKSTQPGFFYLYRLQAPSDDELPSEYANQICGVQLAFYHNGLFHAFEKEASWLDEYLKAVEKSGEVEGQDNAGLPEARKLSSEQVDEIGGEFFAYLVGQGGAIDADSYFLRNQLEQYLHEKYGFPADLYRHYGQEARNSDDGEIWVENGGAIWNNIMKRCLQHEEKLIDELVPQCVDWALLHKLKTITQGETDLFLEGVDKKVSKKVSKAIWQKAKFALKTGKV